VLKWFLPEEYSHEAEKLLIAFLSGAVNLYAPDLLLVETASALWRRSVVRAEMSATDAKLMYRDLLTLPLNLQASDRLAAAAFNLGLTHRHSVYDAFYFALAAEMDCELITADRSLVMKLARTLPYIRHMGSLHL